MLFKVLNARSEFIIAETGMKTREMLTFERQTPMRIKYANLMLFKLSLLILHLESAKCI
jgi:hypothetical protein